MYTDWSTSRLTLEIILTGYNSGLELLDDDRFCEAWSLNKHTFKTFVSTYQQQLLSLSVSVLNNTHITNRCTHTGVLCVFK